MKYDKEEVMRAFEKWHTTETTFAYGVPDNRTIAEWWLERLDAAFKAGREEMEKPLREALRMLEDEIPFTGEEVIAKIKEALK